MQQPVFPPLTVEAALTGSSGSYLSGETAAHTADMQASGVMDMFKFIRAIIPRALFILVSLTGVWRVTFVKGDLTYWFLTFLFLPLVVEMIYTLMRRKGKDYKW